MSSFHNNSKPDIPKSAFGDVRVVSPEASILIHFPYNYNTELLTDGSSGSGSSSVSDQHLVISSGAASSSVGLTESKETLNYNPGLGASVRFAGYYTSGVAGNTQLIGIGDSSDGFFIGFNGTDFSILRRNGGSDTWVSQDNFNKDLLDGSGNSKMVLDPTKGNVYEIQYQWLGYGAIQFCIENPNTGKFIPFHTIQYANNATEPSIENPSLPFRIESNNDSNTTDITTRISSAGAYVEGRSHLVGQLTNCINNTKTITTETNILTIQNKALYASVSNRVPVNPFNIALNNSGTKDTTFKLYLNTTLGGSPSYTDIEATNSVVSYDTAGTTITGGKLLTAIIVQKNTTLLIDLMPWNISLKPTDILTISAESSQSNDASVSISWKEQFD